MFRVGQELDEIGSAGVLGDRDGKAHRMRSPRGHVEALQTLHPVVLGSSGQHDRDDGRGTERGEVWVGQFVADQAQGPAEIREPRIADLQVLVGELIDRCHAHVPGSNLCEGDDAELQTDARMAPADRL